MHSALLAGSKDGNWGLVTVPGIKLCTQDNTHRCRSLWTGSQRLGLRTRGTEQPHRILWDPPFSALVVDRTVSGPLWISPMPTPLTTPQLECFPEETDLPDSTHRDRAAVKPRCEIFAVPDARHIPSIETRRLSERPKFGPIWPLTCLLRR